MRTRMHMWLSKATYPMTAYAHMDGLEHRLACCVSEGVNDRVRRQIIDPSLVNGELQIRDVLLRAMDPVDAIIELEV